ncbi:uncharacterized protein [Spinacia oleracea]|uniref:DUF4283 domain-containing protein n=1 Tax=Spinacia oleracea TaxID=3562 RepID=A0A9R0J0V5_SPIOL|nr:uncharacterized protein LOC110798309 [Spinacia oleracea]
MNEIMTKVNDALGISGDYGISWGNVANSIIPNTEHEETEHLEKEIEASAEPDAQRRLNMGGKPSWATIVNGSSLTANGTPLSFISPTIVDGKPIGLLNKIDVDNMVAIWNCSIVMYIVGDMPSIGAVIRFIAKEWVNVSTPKVFLQDEGYFVIRFASRKDRDSVLMAGPYSFFNRPMIVKPWSAKFNFQEEILGVIPVLVRLPNLPLNYWGPDSLSRIGSLLGIPLFADECTSSQMRVSFPRLLVEIDVTKPLPKHVMLQDPSGGTFTQPVLYDWLPPYCGTCKVVGHICGEGMKQTTRFKPVVPVKMKKDISNNPVADGKVTHTPVTHDDGWRIVTRRRRDPKPPRHILGLAQVQAVTRGFSFDGGGEGEEGFDIG